MKKLSCRLIEDVELPDYDHFIQKHGRVFAQREWLGILAGETTLLGLFDGGQRLIGACPIQQTKKMGLSVIMRQAYTPFLGPFVTDDVKQSARGHETTRFFLNEICNTLKKIKPAICCLPLDISITDGLPFRWHNFKVIPVWTYLIDLSLTVKEIQARFSSTRRRNIRAAERDGIEILETDCLEIVERLATTTFERQKKKLPTGILKKILFEFAAKENSFAFVGYRDGQPISTVFCVYDNQTAYYLVGGYDEKNAHHGAGAACMHAAIIKSKSLGLKTFDFEGSSIPAIETYFRGFGGQQTPYLTVNQAWLPIELMLKIKKREIF